MDNRPIGIFDSGVGGLTVLSELVKLIPNENYIYFGDTARVPYGEKTKEQLFSITRGIFEWFKEQNVKAIIMACNTSSAVVYETFKKEYDLPIFSLILPTAEYVSYLNAKAIGVIATTATVNTKVYSKEIKKLSVDKEVYEVACPGLVEIVEQNKIDTFESKKLLIRYITPLLEKHVEKIILGCTHYPYLSGLIKSFCNNEELLIDPAAHLAQKVYDELTSIDLNNNEENEGSINFYVSANPEKFEETGKRFFKECKGAKEVFIPEIQSIRR